LESNNQRLQVPRIFGLESEQCKDDIKAFPWWLRVSLKKLAHFV
jgi:hypothetical protein